jgi:hypothetical protein
MHDITEDVEPCGWAWGVASVESKINLLMEQAIFNIGKACYAAASHR